MRNLALGTVGKALFLLAYPAVQYLTLRVTLHFILGMRIGFANTTDYDFLLPAPIAFILFITVLDRAQELQLHFQKKILALNLVAASAFVAVSAAYDTLAAIGPLVATNVWVGTLLVAALSSFFVFISPQQILKNPNRSAIIPCLLIGSSLYFYANGFRHFWKALGFATAQVMHGLFSLVQFPGISSYFTAEEALRIDHSLLSVRIGKLCGGGDAFFFFTLTFLLVAVVIPRLALGRSLWVYLTGVLMMFVLNIVRILGLFGIGILLRDRLGFQTGTEIFQMLFHLNLGWILYAVAVFFFFKRTAPYMEAIESRSPAHRLVDAH